MALASIDNEGTIAASGGNLLVYGGVSGTGTLSVATGAVMTLQAAVGSGQTLAFSSNARVVLDDPHAFAGTITGFGRGDVLELANTAATGVSWANGILTVQTAFGSFQLEVAGNFPPNAFSVQSDGLGGSNVTAGGWGDVHMTTFDGLHYDLQSTGDFVAVRSTNGNPWQIQIRTASVPGATSITTELAAQLGDTRVTFAVGRDSAVYIDGVADTTLQSGGVQSFAGGSLARLSADTWRLSWNSGEQVTVSDHGISLDWSVGLGANDGRGSVQGLLGTDSGWARDFQLPNGSYLQPPMNDGMLGSFADAWRVSPAASLFDDMSVPAMPATALPLVPSALQRRDGRRRARRRPSADRPCRDCGGCCASRCEFAVGRRSSCGFRPQRALRRRIRKLRHALNGRGIGLTSSALAGSNQGARSMQVRRIGRWLALAAAVMVLVPAMADARAGAGSSSGSRGSRTNQAPPPTQTAPTAKPVERSVTPQAPAQQPSMASARRHRAPRLFCPQPVPLRTDGRPRRRRPAGHAVRRRLRRRGRHGAACSCSSFLLAGWAIWRSGCSAAGARETPPPPRRPMPTRRRPRCSSSAAPRASGALLGGAPLLMGNASTPLAIAEGDYNAFEALLADVQSAYSAGNLAKMRELVTPEMVGYFSEELSANASRGVENKVEAVKLEQGDLSEAWSEAGIDYATVAMRFSMIDVTRRLADGTIVEGNDHVRTEATEIWTFLRSRGGKWILSAIQQS